LPYKTALDYDGDELDRLSPDQPRKADCRSAFERDRARIIHSAAFRRLQGKTQVFGFGGSDFFRTRLTHSLEVAQIGKGIALQTGFADVDLVEAICLAHDIGHPPFGHTGEQKLLKLMENYGGFEANAQNLRVLTKLEVKYAHLDGLNLTRATLDGVLKYKTPYDQVRNLPDEEKKFHYNEDTELVREISQGVMKKSFECEIMDWADEVAYSVHDLEDGIKAGMISMDILKDPAFRGRVQDSSMVTSAKTFNEDWGFVERKVGPALARPEDEKKWKAQRKVLVANLIDYFVSEARAVDVGGEGHSRYQHSLDISEEKRNQCALLKAIVWQAIINNEKNATLSRKACTILDGLFNEFADFSKKDTRQMFPLDFRERLDSAKSSEERYRVVCDYIAGMTDAYALRVYSRLREPEDTSIFEIL
jgi:dGTPase